LAGELAAACAVGTLPRPLTPGQVWVQEGGRAQLADTPLVADAAGAGPQAEGTDAERSLALLREVALLALDARARGASAALSRLFGTGPKYETVEQFQASLAAEE
jgi:hypothetical protein